MKPKKIAKLVKAAIQAQDDFIKSDVKLAKERTRLKAKMDKANIVYSALSERWNEINAESATARYAMLDAVTAAFPAILKMIDDDFTEK